jgi:hypothetical protein
VTHAPAIKPTIVREGSVADTLPKLGEWYWVKEDGKSWFGCVMKVGSNFVELHGPHSYRGGYHWDRLHVDEVEDRLTLVRDPEVHIAGRVAHYQAKSNRLMQEVRDTYALLGVPVDMIGHMASSSTALAVLSGQDDVKKYETALVVAKDKTLPGLFEKIKEANAELARWMQAGCMPMMAGLGPLEEQIGSVKDRIFNISLYAGLTENVERVIDGAAATMADKLHVMQRRLYMDEECLFAYKAGGMEFKDIRAFDAWLGEPENRDRLLPFPRTIAAFRVRRDRKERDSEGSIPLAFINFALEQADKITFLYIRNGEQLWRICCEMDFGASIFPDATHLDPSEPMMIKSSCRDAESIMPKREYDHLVELWAAKYGKEEKPHPGFSSSSIYVDNHGYFRPDEWAPFDHSNVYYDEGMARIAREIKEYNRVALIIQGLFDRSEVLHPHAPVKSWTAEGFASAIKLVYDGSNALYGGDKPDFEAYRKRLNRSLKAGSVVVGADDYWQRAEAVKENARRSRDWRDRGHWRPTHVTPYGNPGPGDPAVVAQWQPHARKAVFRWERDSARYRQEKHPCTITIPADKLLNVSAYKPGDFKQFFADPRTRAEYLKWAPLLLRAEDYHAGKR